MNYPQTLTHEPDGSGTRWLPDAVDAWLHPKPRAAQKRDPAFAIAVDERIIKMPRTLDEIYRSLPARFRTVEDYRNLAKQLTRRVEQRRIKRMGSAGDYRYFKMGAIKNRAL